MKKRIRQSLVPWCLSVSPWNWDLERICRVAKELGCEAIDLVTPEEYHVLASHGLRCSVAVNGMPGEPFTKGLNNPRYQEEVIARTRRAMDRCAEFDVPNVIAFTGYKWRDADDPSSGEIPLSEGADECVKALRALAPYAEAKGVTVCVEQLNSRDDSHPMKGHPHYQGDNMDYVASIVQRVGSPRVKLLFDIYHVAIMNGDVIRRIRQYGPWIGHVHVAGNPGRAEPDETQEIYYPAVLRALAETGYSGYVAHEFIPLRDPAQSLPKAVALCDV